MSKNNWLDILREKYGRAPKGRKRRSSDSQNTSSPAPLREPLTPNTSSANPANITTAPTASKQFPPTQRIQWRESTSHPVATKVVSKSPTAEPRIDWGTASGSSIPDLNSLIGIEDAYEHTPLVAGERIAYCNRDKIAFHLATWDFLRQENGGRCCICGQSSVITIHTLPGKLIESPIAPELAVRPAILHPGEKVIGLNQIYAHINFAVTVQDYVHEVYCTKSTGTYFVRFEPRGPRDAVYKGFKVVIFPKYERLWEEVGTSIRGYEGHTIRVHGVIQVHPEWDIEILVNSPRVIEIVE